MKLAIPPGGSESIQRTTGRRAAPGRFESLVSDLSTKFITLPPDGFDNEIREGLRRLVEFLNTDRGGLIVVRGNEVSVPLTWARGDVPPDENFSLDHVPWFKEQLRAARQVVFGNLPNGLPEEAVAERQYCLNRGLSAIATIPIFVAGSFLGAISTACFHRKRRWSKQSLNRLRLVGEMLANALMRKESEQEIAQQLLKLGNQYEFEKLISDLSARFVTIPREDLDKSIESTLEELVVLFQMDRLALLKVSDDKQTATVTHSANAPGIPAAPTNINYVEHFPWHAKKILGCEILSLHIVDLPPEAQRDRQSAESMGIRSNLVIPLIVNDSIEYVFAANYVRMERKWDDEMTSRIRLLGEMMANSLARKQAYREAQQHRDELAHISRISAAGELAASIAHELNQPLTGILTNAEAALRLMPPNQSPEIEEIREILTDIVEDDKRAGQVIRKLRSMVRKAEADFVTTDINDLIGSVLTLVKSDALIRNISILDELSEDLPPILGDHIQLQQVLLNLLLNSQDALRDTPSPFRKIIVRSAQSTKEQVEVSVQDFGKGIPEEELQKIFEPFFTTKREGMGMGLSIAQSIIKVHGGKLWAEKNDSIGVTFRFTLPVARD